MRNIFSSILTTFLFLLSFNSDAQSVDTKVQFMSSATREPVPCLVTIEYKGSQKPSEKRTYFIVFANIDLNVCDRIICVPQDGMHVEGEYSCEPIVYLRLLDPKKWEECQRTKAKYLKQLSTNQNRQVTKIGINKKPVSKGIFN